MGAGERDDAEGEEEGGRPGSARRTGEPLHHHSVCGSQGWAPRTRIAKVLYDQVIFKLLAVTPCPTPRLGAPGP